MVYGVSWVDGVCVGFRVAYSVHAEEELFGNLWIHVRETLLELVELQHSVAVLNIHKLKDLRHRIVARVGVG